MTSPLETLDVIRKFYFDVILNEPRKRCRVECVQNDKIRLIFNIYNNRNAQANLSDSPAPTATFRIGKHGYAPESILELTDGAGISFNGGQATVDIDLSEIDDYGAFDYQFRMTFAGSTCVIVADRINIAQLLK